MSTVYTKVSMISLNATEPQNGCLYPRER